MADEAITFQIQHPKFRLYHRRHLRGWLDLCVQKEGQRIAGLHYLFCSDEHMLAMNRKFLNHDYLTDILTFGERSTKGLSGDILISVDRTRDNAKTLKTKPLDELHRVVAHGVLHLMGYTDASPEEKESMREKEDAWLSLRTFLET